MPCGARLPVKVRLIIIMFPPLFVVALCRRKGANSLIELAGYLDYIGEAMIYKVKGSGQQHAL